MIYVINKVFYDDCHALRLFSNALIFVVSLFHIPFTLWFCQLLFCRIVESCFSGCSFKLIPLLFFCFRV